MALDTAKRKKLTTFGRISPNPVIGLLAIVKQEEQEVFFVAGDHGKYFEIGWVCT